MFASLDKKTLTSPIALSRHGFRGYMPRTKARPELPHYRLCLANRTTLRGA